MAILGVKIKPIWRAGFEGGDKTWKVFYEPYHTQIHGTTLFRPIFALSRYLFRPGSPKYGYFWGKTLATMAGWFQAWESTWKPLFAPYYIAIHGNT